MSDTIIRTNGLTKVFGDFTAVDHLDLEVPRGSIFAFLGANGSGKSTTIRMLIGLLTPSDGTVTVDGIDVITHSRRVRDRIGYMGQKVSLYQGLSLRENVEFYAGLYGLSGKDLERRWSEMNERFDLAAVESEQASELPAGIRQRAGLALSTLHAPRLLFLDEPTAGVDVHNRGRFWDLIRDEADSGVTVFVTTHFLEEVEYCDRASMIDAGKLIVDAEVDELRRRYSDGYRIRLHPRVGGPEVIERLLRERFGHAEGTGESRFVDTPEIDGETLAWLDRESAGAEITIEQPNMADVFRRVLREARTS